MPRVVTVTANAALDWTCFVEGLRPGGRHIVRSSHRQAGGKGVNVARVLARAGATVRSIVVIGGDTGDEILRDLERSALEPVPVGAAGESRTCLEVIDEADGSATQLHGAGVAADSSTERSLIAAVEGELSGADWLALCGSLAAGLSLDCYATLIRLARARGVAVALDASGESLRRGLAASPDLLRINRDEADGIGGIEACRGARFGIISNGAREICAWSPHAQLRATPPSVRARNSIGCGDTMLAGILARIGDGEFEAALRFAAALATAAAELAVVGGEIVDRAEALLPAVDVRAVA